MLDLHPHHGLCLLYFENSGYSDLFTAHMGLIRDGFAHADRPVRLTLDADIICIPCPHSQNGRCETADKVRRYDEQVLRLCGLSAGDALSFAAFEELCLERIVRPGKRAQVCGDCCWAQLCDRVGEKRYQAETDPKE